MDRTSTGRTRWPVLAATTVVAVVAGIGVVVANRDDDPDRAATEAEAGGVPTEVLSGPGTELGDGLEVAAGSSLIGPVVVMDVDETQAVASWFAVVLVEADAVDVWRAYANQLAGRFPDTGIPDGASPGCAPGSLDDAEVCHILGHDAGRAIEMSLLSVPGDVTGRYLLHLRGVPLGEVYVDDDEITSGPDELPDPNPARARPGVGEPLAPFTTAYDDDNEEYVVVEGSELLAQFGDGSYTGGFDVMLRVAPTADLQTVVDAYITQATQYDDDMPPPAVIEHQGTTLTVYHPPGGGGGYSGEVIVVDRPEGDDFVVFELTND